jgi:hypothetical protein
MSQPAASPRLRFRPWMLATLLCALYVVLVLARNDGDPLSLVTLGTRFSQLAPDGTEGYDGQFNYYIARDPSTAAAYIDVPAYRFQRILLPALGYALSFGQASLIPWLFLFISLVSLAVGTALLERLLVEHGMSRWYALVYALSIGIFGSVRLSLSEPLAYALALGGILLANRSRWWLAAGLFALAALAKETTLLIPAGYGLYLLSRRAVPTALLFGGISLLPFLVWQLILRAQLGAFGIGSGGAMATGFELIPFAGVARILADAPPEARLMLLLIFGLIVGVFVLVPTLWALYRCWRDWRRNGSTAYTFVLFTTSAIMPFVPFSTYREPLGILRFIVGLQIAVLLYAAQTHNIRVLRYSTFWIVSILLSVSLVTA